MKVDAERDSIDVSPRIRLHVLIVEDSSDDALLMLRELQRGGYEPEHERVDAPETMRQALAEGGPWDVVLSDWQMPRFSGPEALAMFRATGSEAPFIIVSGKVGEELAVEVMKAGAHDYVMKGNLTRLCATVERGLQEAQGRRERRRAEEERDRLFEFSPDLLGVATLDGYFKRVNPAFEETLGYSSEELLAKPFIELVHPEDRAATMSELEGLGRGVQTAYFENRYLCKDGSQVWLEWKAVPVVEEDVIYASARDVTERKRAEEALRRRDAILRAVAFAAERFLRQATPWQESAQEVLERLGQAAEVGRVYIFENYAGVDSAPLPTKRYEWLAPGISAGADNPTVADLPDWAADYSRWGEILGRGELLCGHTREFPQEERPMLEAEGVLSIALVSIFVEGEWWGFIGFDECTSEREWSAAETEALEAAANTLGAAIQRERAEEALRRRDAILRAVGFAAERFLERVASWEESAQEVLERLGVAAEVSRVYIFENYLGEDGEVWLTQSYEWVVSGVSTQMDNPLMQAFPYRAAGYGRWVEMLSRGEPVHGHTRNFPAGEQLELREQDILSIVIVPIFVEGEWWGVIGFDECLVEREWSAAEIDALKAAADTLGAAIQRERAERALRESEERFRATFDQAAVGVAHVSPHGSWLRVNQKLCEIVGYTREELLERTLQDITHPDDLEADLEYQGRLLAGEISRYSMEKRYLRKASSVFWNDLTVSLVRTPSGEPKYFIVIVEDITERKRAGEALVQSEERYRAVVEQAAEGIFLFEVATGEVLESNAAFQELLGYTAQELLNMKLYDLVAHDRESIDSNVQLILDEGSRFVGERRYRCKNGSLVDVEVSASLISYGGRNVICTVIRDITERKRAEEAIRQSEQLYRTVIEQATEYISLVDAETRRFVGSNPAFRETLGYTEEELKRMTLYDIVAHDRESIDQNARQVLERGSYSLGERKHRRKDGSLVDVEVSASTIIHDGREVACIVGHDVTERKRAEEEVRESQRALATLMSNLPGMAYRCRNDPDWTMELVSEGCLELTGYPPADLIGNRRRSYGDLLHPDDQEEVWESVQAALRERRPFQLTYRITTASGAVRWAWEQGRGIFSPEGELLVLEGFITDITERKRDRDALAQSEERYRAVVEQATEGIFLCDAATGEVLESNTAFRELLGYTAEELRGVRIHDLVDDDRDSIDSNLRLILDEGSRFLGERRYRRKDGSLVDIEAAASVISYGGRKVICDVIRDVTERVEAFRLLEERLTALAGISASLTVGQTMEATLDALAARIVQSTAAVACAVVLMNPETGLFRTAGSHGLPEGYTASLEAAYRTGMRPPPVEVFRTRQPKLVRDARQVALNTPFSSPLHGFLHEVPWNTIYFVPFVSRGRSLGVLNLYYLPGQEPGEDETVFLGAVADQTAVAVENAGLFAAVQGKAALEERQRLARELHDSVSQALYGIGLGARTARALLDREGPPERVAEWLEYVLSLAEGGLTEMRALIFELRPESLETEGLVAALEQHAAALRARHEIPVHAALGEEPDLPLETKEALYRIAQEALHNTVKHARASKADLKLECDARGIALEVSDDGAGFDPEGDFSGHLGLKSMRERAVRLGGTLRVESAPGEGTRIRLRIPPDT